MGKMKLGEIVENTISGEWGTEEKKDENDIFVIRTADFCNDGRINYSNIIKRNIAKRKIEEKSLKIGDIIVEKSGGTDKNPVGRVVLFDKENCKCLANNFTQVLRIKKEHYYKFIFYQLFYKYKSGGTLQMFNKTTGIQNLQMKLYLNQELNVCDKKEQIKISNLLDKVQEIVDIRKKEIEELDELIKSQFVEMFENKKFEKTTIGRYAKFQGGYAFKSKDFVEDGVKLVQISNVNKDTLDWLEINRVPENFKERYKEYSLIEDDVVMAMTRPIIKSLNEVKIAQVRKDDLPCLLNQRVGRFIITDKLDKEYLIYCCKSDKFKNYVEKMSGNSLQPNISSKQVENYEINLPPIELQNKFAEFVKQIDKQKFEIQKSLEETQKLQDSLMNKYFG